MEGAVRADLDGVGEGVSTQDACGQDMATQGDVIEVEMAVFVGEPFYPGAFKSHRDPFQRFSGLPIHRQPHKAPCAGSNHGEVLGEERFSLWDSGRQNSAGEAPCLPLHPKGVVPGDGAGQVAA